MEGLFKRGAHPTDEDLAVVVALVSLRAMELHSLMGYLVISTSDSHVILPFTRTIKNGC